MTDTTQNLYMASPDVHASCTMGDLLIRSIQRGADRVAFVSRGEPVSYTEFGRRLSRFVWALSDAGVSRGSGVACLAGNTVEAYLVTAACFLLGARITNLHPMGSNEDHAYIVQHSEASVLIFDPDPHEERANAMMDEVLKARAVSAAQASPLKLLALGASAIASDLCALAQARPESVLINLARPGDVCLLVYTGGTTGKPKGVVHTHRSFVAVMMAELAEWEWPRRPIFLAITPISHGAGPCIVPVLLRGGTVILESGFSPEGFLAAVERHDVNATFLVPTMIYKVLDYLQGARPMASTLEMVIYGAAPMAATRMTEALDIFGPVFMQLYAQSEAPNCVTVLRRADHDPQQHPSRLSSCGQAIGSIQVALLDEMGQPVEPGQPGEICVRGPLVMAGYWKDPEETARALRHGWLHTGDLARVDADGYFYIVGRSKDMIITGGFNVYPAEVEDVLCAHPSVSAAAVIGVPDRIWGEAVTALVTLRPGEQASAEDIIAQVRSAKGPICAPKSVIFVDTIPLTPLGKPDKKALRAQFAQEIASAS